MGDPTRPRSHGKFLYVGDKKYWVRGVTYGAFPPHSRGDWFPDEPLICRDFALMRAAGINTILTYTLPSTVVLDLACAYGLKVIVNIPWFGCDYALEQTATRSALRKTVRSAVASSRGHPAVLMWCIGKELSPDIVRWHGKRPTERLLHDLYAVAKDEDPEALVTYTNFPTTEYLELPFLDVCTYNVYLHSRPEFSRYLARLQHVAGELPLVLTELGICSFRHGRDVQAMFLKWQFQEVFDHGCAGAVVFSWTDPFYGEREMVEDWGFGLVDVARQPKPSYDAARERFVTGVPFPANRRWPRTTVVVAAYNAALTLDACLSSLSRLNYPDYEVVVVNDGSTDCSAEVIARHPFRTITTPNCGVSAARNEGLRVATGDVVAYIDADARADEDWLAFLVGTLIESSFAAVGGPNLLPPEDEWVARCVYRSPGGPTHVMLDDESAEHIPGCNMAYRKSDLESIGGFDPMFRVAGDDVDVCWRLIAAGLGIGFSPAALVWHHRRPSVRGYWRQQVGYGVAEALLEKKHANKFNPWGDALWAGRIYSPYPFFRLHARPVVYHGLWGSAPFQPLYDSGGQSFLSRLPRMPVWYAAPVILVAFSTVEPRAMALVGAWSVYTLCYAVACAARADLFARVDLPGPFSLVKMRATVALLHVLEPVARAWGRLNGGLTPWRQVRFADAAARRFGAAWTVCLKRRVDKGEVLSRMTKHLAESGAAVHWNEPQDAWDLRVRRGATASVSVRVVVQQHDGPSWRARFRVESRAPFGLGVLTSGLAVACIAIAFDAAIPAGALIVCLAAGWVFYRVATRRLTGAIQTAAALALVEESENKQ